MANRNEIIAVASKLFVEKGFEKTTMDDIANALGVQKGSLYHHINSKSELFYDIIILGFEDSAKDIEQICSSNLRATDKFRLAISVHFKNIFKNSLEYQVLLNERRHMLDSGQETRVRRLMKTYENSLLGVVMQGMDEGIFRDDLNPRIIVAGIIGVGNSIYKWFSYEGHINYDEVAMMYIEFFMKGIENDES